MNRPRIRDRSTGDLLVLMVAFTICVSVMFGGALITLVEVFHPSSDTQSALRTITGIINTLIGLLAGFLAGRTGAALGDSTHREEATKPEATP